MSDLKASDLRLDNLVYGPLDEICQVKELGNSLNPNLVGYRELNNLKSWGQNGQRPIPITEEWLVKFGFKKIDNLFLSKCGFYEYYLSGTFNASNAYYTIALDIKNVHQLQNLYFTLTGVEL